MLKNKNIPIPKKDVRSNSNAVVFNTILSKIAHKSLDEWMILCGAASEDTPISDDARKKFNIDSVAYKSAIITTASRLYLEAIAKTQYGLCWIKGREPHIYDGQCWREIESACLDQHLISAVSKMGLNPQKAGHHKFIENLHSQIKMIAYKPEAKKQSEDTVLINFQNCTLKVTKTKTVHEDSSHVDCSFEMVDHSKDDNLFYVLPYDYFAGAGCPMFQKFLDRVLPDAASQANVAEYLGVCLAGGLDIKCKQIMLLYGESNTGKSTLVDIISYVFGEVNVSNVSIDAQLQDMTERASLDGKLLNVVEELDENAIRKRTDFFKILSEGKPVDVRHRYNDSYKMTQYARNIVCTNDLPIAAPSSAIYNRLLIIPFDQDAISKEEKKPNLARDISESESSGILNWILAGLERYLENGQRFTDNDTASTALDKYKTETDTVLQFIEGLEEFLSDTSLSSDIHPDMLNWGKIGFIKDVEDGRRRKELVRAEEIAVPLKELYECYKQWYMVSCSGRCMSSKTFEERLSLNKAQFKPVHNKKHYVMYKMPDGFYLRRKENPFLAADLLKLENDLPE